MLEEPELAAELAGRARRRVVEFTVESMAGRWRRSIERLSAVDDFNFDAENAHFDHFLTRISLLFSTQRTQMDAEFLAKFFDAD